VVATGYAQKPLKHSTVVTECLQYNAMGGYISKPHMAVVVVRGLLIKCLIGRLITNYTIAALFI